MLALTIVDISYNQLEGPIPSIPAFKKAPIEALKHNKGLCGNVSGSGPCKFHNHNKTSKILVVVLPLILGFLLLPLFVYGLSYIYFGTSSTKEYKPTEESQTENIFALWSFDGKMVHENIIEATEEFDTTYNIRYLPK